MASRDADDGSEDVADFLERIRELGEQRVREDEERARKLEEEILQGRKERQARRAERARSISPTKDSPLSSSFTTIAQLPDSPTPRSRRTEALASTSPGRSPQLPSNTMDPYIPEPSKPTPPPSSAGLARSGTLSWQQRPSSRGTSPTVRSRPLSTATTELPLRSSQDAPDTSPSSTEPSRNQIASLLEGKDPSWFRQTEDRGKESAAAYRKNESAPDVNPSTVQLHGLSKQSPVSGIGTFPRHARGSRSPSPLREDFQAQGALPSKTADAPAERSPLPTSPMPSLSSQRFQPPTQNSDGPIRGVSPTRSPTMSPSQGRISPERMDRPSSPTKGLGGFVQSAMMKRSDSVNKRWSAQAAAGLTRGNSVLSNRSERSPTRIESAYDQDPKQSSNLGEGSFESSNASSRPQSYVSTHKILDTKSDASSARPSDDTPNPDPKRWSPTKSSWLEAAINKSEPPKAKPVAPSQPSWMADINRAKEVRNQATSTSGITASEASANTPTSVIPGSPSRVNRATDRSSVDLKSTTQTKGPGSSPSKDFRGSLRSRPPPAGDSQNTEPEFKNVFGKLKKTETKNYKAPDELKDNILRGKAGLSITGGPRPWQKKDEFKDSILQKKKEMRDGTSVVNTGNMAPPPASQVPEAIAKRSNMTTKPGPEVGPKPSADKARAQPVPEAIAARSAISSRPLPGMSVPRPTTASPKPLTKTGSAPVDKMPASPPSIGKKPSMEPSKPHKTNSAPVEPTSRPQPSPTWKRSSVEASKPAPRTEPSASAATEILTKVESNSSDTLTRTQSQASTSSTGSKLADRFNPALAGILARGPPGSGSSSPAPRAEPSSQVARSRTSKSDEGAQLTHATKSRARGPKRRPPKNGSAVETPAANSTDNVDGNGAISRNNRDSQSLPSAKVPFSAAKSASTTNSPTFSKPGPQSSPKPPTSAMKFAPSQRPLPSPSSVKSPPPIKPMPNAPDDTQSSELSAASNSPASPVRERPPPQRSLSPAKIGAPIDRSTGAMSPTIRRTEALVGGSASAAFVAAAASSLKPQIKSPPPTGAKPAMINRTRTNESEPASQVASLASPRSKPETMPRSTHAQEPDHSTSSDAAKLIAKVFGQPLSTVSRNKADVDAQKILEKKSTKTEVSGIKKQVWEVSGDGKKTLVSMHEDHVLFDNSLLLCNHTFETRERKRQTEVYLWAGKEVSPSAIEDAQYFSRNHAKEAGAKLTVIEQGKEPAELIDALGGIVITRRGTRSTAGNARYLLCGRKYFGDVVFDELDFSADHLCTGFPFVVVPTIGNDIYLWKGKAAETELVSMARLMVMNLDETKNVVEADEGNEPDAFWKAFGGSGAGSISPWSPSESPTSWAKYKTRLFAIDADARPKSSSSFLQWARRASTPGLEEQSGLVREIVPFAQSDLNPDGIFVLDGFFEIYVIVGADASSKLASFHLALVFAEEYGLLAASLEDRPFIPTGKAVLGGPLPEGLHRSFRFWDNRVTPTAKQGTILPLHEALEAFNVGG